MLRRLLLDPQGGEGGNGAAADTKADQGEGRAPDLGKVAESLASKHGDPLLALKVVLNEGYQYRDQIRDLKAKAPKDGAIVLEGDDAKHWSHYKQFGPPGDLKKALEAGKQYEAEAATYRKAEKVRAAAEITTIEGVKLRATVLATLAKDVEIDFEEQQGKDGKAVRVAIVKGEGDSKTPLADYAATHWADFLPSLKLDQEKPRVGTPTTPRPRTVPAGNGAEGARRVPRSTF